MILIKTFFFFYISDLFLRQVQQLMNSPNNSRMTFTQPAIFYCTENQKKNNRFFNLEITYLKKNQVYLVGWKNKIRLKIVAWKSHRYIIRVQKHKLSISAFYKCLPKTIWLNILTKWKKSIHLRSWHPNNYKKNKMWYSQAFVGTSKLCSDLS